MSNLTQSAASARPTAKLRATLIAAAISCLGGMALATPDADADAPTGAARNHVSFAQRVNLRKQSHKQRTSTVKSPVQTTAAPAPVPAPSRPPIATPTKPTIPTTPATPTTPKVPTAPKVPTTPTTPTTPTVARTPSADSIFTGAKLKDFSLQQGPGATTEVSDPLGSGEQVLKMTVSDKDVAPITPTENPRAQALSPDVIHDGDEIWLSTKFMLPADFPSSVPGWLALVSIYGAPFGGSSPWQVGLEGNTISWMRNGTYDYDVPWQMPLVKGRWITILLHERFASDGWVEMWIDGAPVKFFAGSGYNPNQVAATEHLAMRTMDSSNNGSSGNAAKIMNYRKVGMFSSATVYFGALRIGRTRASVGA